MSDEESRILEQGHQPHSGQGGYQPSGDTKGYQPQASDRPEGQNPPSGGSNVMPPANVQSDKKE